MNNAKRGMIPPYSIFFLFYISRVVVSLTYIQTICAGFMCSDLLISIVLSFFMTLILSVPSYLCYKKGIVINNRFLGVLYCAFFIIKTSVNISRFSGFATSRLNPTSSSFFFAILIGIAICYCAYLGIEGLSRFSVYAGFSVIFATVLILSLNFNNIKTINLFPIIQNEQRNILYNALIMTANSIESAVLICLVNRVNGSVKKSFYMSMFAQYLTLFLLVFTAVCVLGSNAILQPYPIFTLFQMATGSTLSRLDIIHTSFWVLAVLIKCSLLIYCASISIKKFSHSKKCIVFTAISVIVSVALSEIFVSQIMLVSKQISIFIYLIFCVIIPIFLLIFNGKRGRKVEKNI